MLLALVLPLSAQPVSTADLSADFFIPERLTVSEEVFVWGYVTNRGPDPATNVVVTTSAGRFGEQTACSKVDGNRCTIDFIAPGEGQHLSIVVDRELEEGTLPITISVTSSAHDPNPRNDRVSGEIALTLAPQMAIYLYAPPADPAGTTTVTATVTNQAPIAAIDPTFTIPLLEGWGFAGTGSGKFRCSVLNFTVTCTTDRIAAGTTEKAEILLRAPDLAKGGFVSVPVTLTTRHGLFAPANAVFHAVVYRHLRVTNTSDQGEGSLREAMTTANAECQGGAPPCKIAFDIPGTATHYTIRPASPLPVLTTNIEIDGSYQTKRFGDTNPHGPEIEINGSLLASGNGLESRSMVFQMRDLVVNGFPGHGVVISGTGFTRTIERCYIGTDVTGQRAVPNGGRGVVIEVQQQYYSASTTIRDSVISGNARSGIFVANGFQITITGNRIGTTAGERADPLGNGASGVYLGPGTSAVTVQKNVISFNAEAGIAIATGAGYIHMLSNSMTGNGTIGIDYGLDLVTPNPGPNQYSSIPSYPVLTSARYDEATGTTRIEGTSAYWGSGVTYVELFASSVPGGEADLLLGRVRPTAPTFAFDYRGDLRGRYITSTYTQPNSYYPEIPYLLTSELSAPIKVEGEAQAPFDRSIVVPRGADLSLRITPPYRFNAGMGTSAYAFLSNYGPVLPKDVVVEIEAEGATLRATDPRCEMAGATLRCAISDGYYFTFGVDVPFESTKVTLRGRATTSEVDPDPSDNVSVVEVPVSTLPMLDARVGSPGPVEPGETATYSVWVVNHAAARGQNAELRIPLPDGWALTGDTSDIFTCTHEGKEIVCRAATIEGSSQHSFAFFVRAPDREGAMRELVVGRLFANGEFFWSSIYVGYQTFHVLRVTTTADEGEGSLRDALSRANEDCRDQYNGPECKVVFSIDGSKAENGVFTIRPTRPLPAIFANDLLIDARTQTRHSGDTNPLGPEVVLNGALTTGSGLEIESNGITHVRGMVINGFPDHGIIVRAPERQYDYRKRRAILDNYIGTDPTGTQAVPNGGRGIVVETAPDRTTNLDVISNLISGNARAGIFAESAEGMRILGNRIVHNGASGVFLGRALGVHVESNEIANNAHAGIGVARDAKFIAFRNNAAYDNGGLGIDHGLDLVTFNDAPDRVAELPRFPVITSAVWDESAKLTRIEGRAYGSRSRDVVELFANVTPDGTGYGEGQRPLGTVMLKTTEGEQTFTFVIAEDLRGKFVAATLTRGQDWQGSDWTSEIGQSVPVQ